MSRPIHEQACYPPGMYHGTNLSINADGSVGVAPGAPKPHPGDILIMMGSSVGTYYDAHQCPTTGGNLSF